MPYGETRGGCALPASGCSRAFFNGVEHQPNAGLLVPERSIHNQVERIRGVPIGLVKLADGVRPALVFVPYAALSLSTTEPVTAHHPLDANRQGSDSLAVASGENLSRP
jgi:hypothetical protein